MAEETTEINDPPSTTEVPEATASLIEGASNKPEPLAPAETTTLEAPAATNAAIPPSEQDLANSTESPAEPDEIQTFIDKAFETIQHEVESVELGKFLRAHIKTFHEEFDALSPSAKDAYVHMMTSQLLQRKAAATQIGIGNEFKLPVPSAQTQLFESIQQSQVKPQKRRPVLLMPPNLRPTYSLKK